MRFVALIFLFGGILVAQNVRYDAPFPSITSIGTTPYLIANVPPVSPVLAVCHNPANNVPCTNYATTYTGAGIACPNGAQDTPQPSALITMCQASGDARGNIGFWAPAGTYDYTVCVGSSCFGPYTIQLISGGGNPGGVPAGSNSQIQINNNGMFGAIVNVVPGSALVSNGLASVPIFQAKQVIDARDLAGVDCTGATDSSAALNALTIVNGIANKVLSFQGCAQIKLINQWLIKGQENTTIDFGGIFSAGSNQPLFVPAGVDIVGCPTSNQSDAMIRIDDTGFSAFRGGTFEAQSANCNFSFSGSIRLTNSQTGGFTTSRDRFDNMWFTSTTNGNKITNYYGFKIDGAPNMEGIGFHHIVVQCQNSAGSIGIWINAANADSTMLDEASHVNGCMWGVRADSGNIRVRDSHVGGNGSFAVFGSGGSNFYEGASGCVQELSDITSAETSGAWLFTNGSGYPYCRRSIFNNNVGFPNIDPSLYVVQLCNGSATFFANSFTNGGLGVSIHNNTIVGCDANGLTGPNAEVYDAGGNNIIDSGNTTAFNFVFQPFDSAASQNYAETHLGRTSPITNIVGSSNKIEVAGGTNSDWALFPTGGPTSTNQSWPSARLIFSRALYNATAPVFDQFIAKAIGASSTVATLAWNYKNASGYTVTPYIGIQPALSGITFAQVAAPSFDPVNSNVTNAGTAGSTTYTYVLVARGGCGSSAASGNGTTTTGNATLSATNYNVIHIEATAGAWGFDIYRTVGGATQGKIGTALATDYDGSGTAFLIFNDTGLAGDASSAPTVNNSGCVQLPSMHFANLGMLPNGTMVYCDDCKNVTDDTTGTFDSVAASGGHGTNVLRENGAWRVH